MRVYVERNKFDGIKCGRVNDGYVIGCIDVVGGYICFSVWFYIWYIFLFNEIYNKYWDYILV